MAPLNDNDLEGADIWGNNQENNDEIDDETRSMTLSELRQRIHLLDNDIRVMRSDIQRITHESHAQRDRIKENMEKVKVNKQLPYLVGNVVEVLEPDAEDGKLFFNLKIKIKNMCRNRGGGRRRSSSRCRFPTQNPLSRNPHLHPSNNLPPRARPRGRQRTQTLRSSRNQQRFLPHPRKTTCGIRLTRESNGGG